jgi:catalase
MDKYAQQHTINGYRFELGQVMNTSIVGDYITKILNPIDNCFARRVAFGIGAPMPELGSASTRKPNATYPSSYPLGSNMSLPVAGLSIAALANDNALTMTDFQTLTAAFGEQKLNFAVIGPHAGMLATGVPANMSYLTGASVFYGAVVLGSGLNGTATDADPFEIMCWPSCGRHTVVESHWWRLVAVWRPSGSWAIVAIPQWVCFGRAMGWRQQAMW